MKIVISVLGRDRVGIIAMVATVLAENGVNILNLDQTIVDGFFNMIMTADMAGASISLKELQEICGIKAKQSAWKSEYSMRIFSKSCTGYKGAIR
jgi:ACT domain-containing protein